MGPQWQQQQPQQQATSSLPLAHPRVCRVSSQASEMAAAPTTVVEGTERVKKGLPPPPPPPRPRPWLRPKFEGTTAWSSWLRPKLPAMLKAGPCAVMALERIPADVRNQKGGNTEPALKKAKMESHREHGSDKMDIEEQRLRDQRELAALEERFEKVFGERA